MNIHYLQHEPFEDLASIYDWANKPGNKISCTKFYEKNFNLPSPSSIDLLIIMGGAMSVYEEDQFHWLRTEKQFIREVIAQGKKVLGICLGSQLIAEVLGAKVYKNHEKEIGWYDVQFTEESKADKLFGEFPKTLKVFHWHGDTYDLPPGAKHIAKSAACKHQAFTYQNQVVGIQFHMEATRKSVEELAFHCKEELVDGNYIQKEEDILKNAIHLQEMNNHMVLLLDKLVG